MNEHWNLTGEGYEIPVYPKINQVVDERGHFHLMTAMPYILRRTSSGEQAETRKEFQKDCEYHFNRIYDKLMGTLVSEKTVADLIMQLYTECTHGDDEHRKWLKDKFESFIAEQVYTTRPENA